ncbi:MAG: phenylacetate-CoA oxygenase subunit PaaC, partial [Acidobacteriota bacterium]|nr:phenylacetate-CoA oxygenase subunit PaaC [Acidobacteriota bacterium]
MQNALFHYLLRLGDDALVLGQRLSEWCGHGPILEEDIALTNIALDLVGRAESLLKLAGQIEGKGRSEDDLAYHRDEYEFFNCQLVERPNGHFGDTLARQFLFDAHAWLLYTELAQSEHEGLAALAAKSLKEVTYHLRHGREWVLRLGDGTDESRERIQGSIDQL